MKRVVNTAELTPTSAIPEASSVGDYNVSVEINNKSIELPFKPKTPLDVGNIALKEVIWFETPSPESENISEFVATEDDSKSSRIPETPAGAEIDADIAEKLSGFRRESLEGRQGPEYNNKGERHTEQENIARYQDWVRGTGRMLDVAWDEGTITDDNLQAWMALKQRVEDFHGTSDFYELSDIGPFRFEVFDFVKKLGVSDRAYAAYDAATE